MDESENGTLRVRSDQARPPVEVRVETVRWQEERDYFSHILGWLLL